MFAVDQVVGSHDKVRLRFLDTERAEQGGTAAGGEESAGDDFEAGIKDGGDGIPAGNDE